MKRRVKSAIAAGMVCTTLSAFGGGVFGTSSRNAFYQDPSSPTATWSGTMEDLAAIVAQAKANYGFEESKHLGRNATMLIPATLKEMEKEIERGNTAGWETTFWDGAHAQNADSDDWDVKWLMKSFGSGVVKYINPSGGEVVYDAKTGKIVKNEKLGSKNFNTDNTTSSAMWGGHQQLDMAPHKTKADPNNAFDYDGDQYKYVGILYERDPNNPDKYHLVDGQTGKRLTKRQAVEFPTTLSDIWKDRGLICVANDAVDMAPPSESTINTAMVSAPVQAVQTPSGTVNTAPVYPSQAIDGSVLAEQALEQVRDAQSRRHCCTSFEFVKDYEGADRSVYAKRYRCTECGKDTMVNVRDGETIEGTIAENKRKKALTDQSYDVAQSGLQRMAAPRASQGNGGMTAQEAEMLRLLTEYGPVYGGMALTGMAQEGKGPLAGSSE